MKTLFSTKFSEYLPRKTAFDIPDKYCSLRNGEAIILEVPNAICRNNTSCTGNFCITNLRLLWIEDKNGSRNIQLPYNQIYSIKSRAAGKKNYVLSILTKYENSSCLISWLLTQDLLSQIEQSKLHFIRSLLYREALENKSITRKEVPTLLPNESVCKRFDSVKCIEKQLDGNLVITTLRLIWWASSQPEINYSIPLIMINRVTQGSSMNLKIQGLRNAVLLRNDSFDKYAQEFVELLEVSRKQKLLVPHYSIPDKVQESFPSVMINVDHTNTDLSEKAPKKNYDMINRINLENLTSMISSKFGNHSSQDSEELTDFVSLSPDCVSPNKNEFDIDSQVDEKLGVCVHNITNESYADLFQIVKLDI